MTKASIGLFIAFAVHDAEELITMPSTSRATLSALPRWVSIPKDFRAHGVSQAHASVGIAIMSALVGSAALAGARSSGKSACFRGVLLAFGAHGFTHIASALALRRYTTGVVTAPIVVIPFWLWARRVLLDNGVREHDARSSAVAASALPVILAVHAITRVLLGSRSVGGRTPSTRKR
ncbi:HXXEE domain-containing protein [Microbacterium sp.]|uniref:HXXEE domain-containing protein n=1 Tax=Microbacterium sp. TaxID=51671 RepID=UPI0039E54979